MNAVTAALISLVTLAWASLAAAQIHVPTDPGPIVVPPVHFPPGFEGGHHGDGGGEGLGGVLFGIALLFVAGWLVLAAVSGTLFGIWYFIHTVRERYRKKAEERECRERAPFMKWYVQWRLSKKQFTKKQGPFSTDELRMLPLADDARIRSEKGQWCEWSSAYLRYPELVVSGIIPPRP